MHNVQILFSISTHFKNIENIMRTDLFVEVTNLMKGNTVWVHFMETGYFPTNIHLSRPILKESVRIETYC